MNKLLTLFGALGDRFIADCWPNDALVAHDDVGRFTWWSPDGPFASLAAFAEAASSTDAYTMVYSGEQRDESTAFAVEAEQTPLCVVRKTMFSVGRAELHFPEIHDFLTSLHQELRLPDFANARSIVYGSFGGPAAAWHWDAGANFIVQVAGSKRWKISRNSLIEHPPDRYSVAMGEWSERLAGLIDSPPPTTGPTEYTEVTLTAGSVLFLPAGWWHSTESDAESLAVNFTFGIPDRLRVVTRLLTQRLRSQEAWREPAVSASAEELDGLLAQLAGEIASMSASDLL